jgi:hypothetical protein
MRRETFRSQRSAILESYFSGLAPRVGELLMSDKPVVHIGENSPENVAYKLLWDIVRAENKKPDRKAFLSTYAECLRTVRAARADD